MKKLKGWDAYVQESSASNEHSIELPLTPDEVYIIEYPSRRQGLAIAAAQKIGDMDALLAALLGEVPGKRVAELSADHPGYVLDEFLIDVMRKFGFIPDETTMSDVGGVDEAGKSSPTRSPRTTTRKRGGSRVNSSTA